MTELLKENTGINPVIKDRIEKIHQGIVPVGYKKTRIGIIPREWKIKKISEIADVISGGTPKTTVKEYWDGDINWATPTDITKSNKIITETSRKISEKGLKNSSAQLLPKNSILMTSRATIGECAINKTPMATNQGFKSLIPKENINYEYLYYLIAIYKNRLQRLANGSTFLEVSTTDVKNLTIHYPSVLEQQKIADILSTWDRAIELKEALIKEKEDQKKGLMEKVLKPKKHWVEKKIGSLVERTKGKPVNISSDGKYKVLGIQYLNAGAEPEYTNDKSVFARKEDILLLWDGANAGNIYTDYEGIVSSTFMRLRPKDINSIFIREYMRKDEAYIKSIREGSGIPHIPRDFLSYYKIFIPPRDEQESIAKLLSSADKLISLLKQEVELLKEQKKGLMQLLLTGIVRVGEVEELE